MEKQIPIKQAITEAKKKYGYASDMAIREAVRNNKIPHRRTSKKLKARISLKVSDVLKYLESLNRG